MKIVETEGRMCIVGHGPYAITYGRVIASDEEIVATKSVRVYEARSIRYWYGRKGGITSLAVYGPCGPRVSESRIGAPAVSSLLMDVKAVHECSPEAIKAFITVRSYDE